jgi:hypothetical protein|nr:MAG TPA: hypothetical protein [Caudoviricetes sp.]DAR73536.1 MAG TPA: hypothetical protein [Caudoviricetes sp.]DAU41691.1 MAG TPA: hypothetical protein [Caudoviricetes sp.]
MKKTVKYVGTADVRIISSEDFAGIDIKHDGVIFDNALNGRIQEIEGDTRLFNYFENVDNDFEIVDPAKDKTEKPEDGVES